jgi:hypothetical protein
VITFNYDDSLERELGVAGKWDVARGYGFPLGDSDIASLVVVLKLHGSMNWLVSILGAAEAGSLVVTPDGRTLGNFPVIHPDDLNHLGYDHFEGRLYQSGGAFPCLILPGRSKEFFYDTSSGRQYVQFWDDLWHQASAALRQADQVTICGYSLLSVDQRARKLLIGVPQRDARISVVSGSQSERIANDYRAAGFRNIEVFGSGYFEDWVQQMPRPA